MTPLEQCTEVSCLGVVIEGFHDAGPGTGVEGILYVGADEDRVWDCSVVVEKGLCRENGTFHS